MSDVIESHSSFAELDPKGVVDKIEDASQVSSEQTVTINGRAESDININTKERDDYSSKSGRTAVEGSRDATYPY